MSENEKKIAVVPPDIPTEQPIDPDNIWGDDKLKRKPFADDLTRRIEHSAKKQSFAVSLHGSWGTGKTYLLRRWQAQLQKEEWRVVYFNAWEDDFQADPLTAIIGQLWKEVKEGDFAEMGKSLKSLVGKLGEKTLGAVGAKKKDFQSAAEETVDNYLTVRKNLEEFKERLATLAAAVKKDTRFPLVFVVDELDRCRPTFAIEVLERIKHLFGAPNIVFVFGVNKTGLQESIKSVYGNIDTEDYLRRFFDINLALPPASAKAYCEHLLSQHKDLADALNVRHYPSDVSWPDATKHLFAPLVGYMNLPLRQVEHAFRLLRFAVNARCDPNTVELSVEGWSISLFILLKMKNPAMYAEFINGKVRCAAVIDFFLASLPDPLDNAERVARFVESHIYCLARGDEQVKIYEGLECLQDRKNLNSSIAGFLAKRTIRLSSDEAEGMIMDVRTNRHEPNPRKVVAALLDLADAPRR